jgi:glyoxylase-like metal-dependent hydrolase (beta-lactamase superfamily II)
MTEPTEVAAAAEQVTDGVWHWRIRNHRIGDAVSSSQLVQADGEAVLVDPVRLDPGELAKLPRPTAIALTAKCHQRSAWRYREEFGAPVWAPEGTVPMDAEPDRRYRAGDVLPGGLRALHTPGPEDVHFSFLLGAGGGVLLCSDLLGNQPGEGLDFIPLQFHDDPEQTRRSVQGLLDEEFAIICLDHGPPVTDDPKAAIRALLQRTA